MSAAYIKAVTEAALGATIFDRSDVQKLANEAVSKIRRDEIREAEPEDKKGHESTQWLLLENLWNLTEREDKKPVALRTAAASGE